MVTVEGSPEALSTAVPNPVLNDRLKAATCLRNRSIVPKETGAVSDHCRQVSLSLVPRPGKRLGFTVLPIRTLESLLYCTVCREIS